MKYMGSKNRIAKDILPLMLKKAIENNINTWIEPFVGGGNMIDKVPNSINRIGLDKNPHAISALIAIRDLIKELPDEISEDYYKSLYGNEASPISSLIRFGASFGGKFEGGFARGKSNDGKSRNYWNETKRNAIKQSPYLNGVVLKCGDYKDISSYENCLIYCDPPYQGTTSYKTGTFEHDKFWDWCRMMSKNNLVFISEYNAPLDFKCIWEGSVKTNFSSSRKTATHNAIEKLFTLESNHG